MSHYLKTLNDIKVGLFVSSTSTVDPSVNDTILLYAPLVTDVINITLQHTNMLNGGSVTILFYDDSSLGTVNIASTSGNIQDSRGIYKASVTMGLRPSQRSVILKWNGAQWNNISNTPFKHESISAYLINPDLETASGFYSVPPTNSGILSGGTNPPIVSEWWNLTVKHHENSSGTGGFYVSQEATGIFGGATYKRYFAGTGSWTAWVRVHDNNWFPVKEAMNPSNNQVLNYNSTTQQWENKTISSGTSYSDLYFDVVTPTSAAQLNTAIANCTKPNLLVVGTTLNISEAVVINGKSNLNIIANNLELILTSWNNGTQGIMLDLQGNISNVKIQGFRFNCPLTSSSPAVGGTNDGGGYGIVIARGQTCPSLDRFTIQDCYFTSPDLHQNAISLVSVGWGGFGTRTNCTILRCRGENIKRMFVEVTNQETSYSTNGTVRYSNIVIADCYAKNLGNNGVDSSGGMMVSFDGPGDNNEVRGNTVINAYFAAYEAVLFNNSILPLNVKIIKSAKVVS